MSDPSGSSNEASRDNSRYSVQTNGAGFVATVPKIRTVGISNICAIESYSITRIANSTSHFVRFVGGGDLQFAFSDKGELLQLSGHRIQFDVSESGDVNVSQYMPE